MAFDNDLDDGLYQETRFFSETIKPYHNNLTLDSVIEVRRVGINSIYLKDSTNYFWQINLPSNVSKIDID